MHGFDFKLGKNGQDILYLYGFLFCIYTVSCFLLYKICFCDYILCVCDNAIKRIGGYYDVFIFAAALGGLGLFLSRYEDDGRRTERAVGISKNLLDSLTRNRFLAMLTGLIFSAIIQSSSATTVMIVGFVNAGLMNLIQAAPIIMGANIGTTVTAQIIALNITEYAPAILIIGVVLSMINVKKVSRYAEVVIGFGVLFIGLGIMSEALKPLRDNQDFINIMLRFKNPITGILAGTVFTAIIQSSSASVGILQAIAAQGLITLNPATHVLMGMNIGTCVTAMLASIIQIKQRGEPPYYICFSIFSVPCCFSCLYALCRLFHFSKRCFPVTPCSRLRLCIPCSTCSPPLFSCL